MDNVSDPQRADFIAQMIAELMRQKELDEATFNAPPPKAAATAFKTFCYDYPELETGDLEKITKALDSLASGSSEDSEFRKAFWLHEKFVENVVFMAGSGSRSETPAHDKAAAQLCASLFLQLPPLMLSMRREAISSLFSGPLFSEEDVDEYDSRTSMQRRVMDWVDICESYLRFIRLGSASLFSGLGSEDLIKQGYLSAICGVIKSLNSLNPPTPTQNTPVSIDQMTLIQYLVINGKEGESTNPAAEDEEMPKTPDISSIRKDIWVHLVFVCRDVMTSIPETIVSTLPALGDALYPMTEQASGGPISAPLVPSISISVGFPTSPECLFVIICSTIAATIVQPLSHRPKSAAGVAVVGDSASDTSAAAIRSRVLGCARTALRRYLTVARLTSVVGICERMVRYGTDDGLDAATLLLDICSLFAADITPGESSGTWANAITAGVGSGVGGDLHPHDRLTSSRMLALLSQLWATALGFKSKDKAKGKGAESTVDKSEEEADRSSPVAILLPRLAHTFAALALQRAETARYLLRLPGFVSSISTGASKWQSSSDATNDAGGKAAIIGASTASSSASRNARLHPGDVVSLLVALLFAVVPDQKDQQSAQAAASIPAATVQALQDALKAVLASIESSLTQSTAVAAAAVSISATNDTTETDAEAFSKKNDTTDSDIDIASLIESSSVPETKSTEEETEPPSGTLVESAVDPGFDRGSCAPLLFPTGLLESLVEFASDGTGAHIIRSLGSVKAQHASANNSSTAVNMSYLRLVVEELSRNIMQLPVPKVNAAGKDPSLDNYVRNVEDAKRVVKSLQSLLEGFRSSKSD